MQWGRVSVAQHERGKELELWFCFAALARGRGLVGIGWREVEVRVHECTQAGGVRGEEERCSPRLERGHEIRPPACCRSGMYLG